VEEDEGFLTVDIMRFSTKVAEGKAHTLPPIIIMDVENGSLQ